MTTVYYLYSESENEAFCIGKNGNIFYTYLLNNSVDNFFIYGDSIGNKQTITSIVSKMFLDNLDCKSKEKIIIAIMNFIFGRGKIICFSEYEDTYMEKLSFRDFKKDLEIIKYYGIRGIIFLIDSVYEDENKEDLELYKISMVEYVDNLFEYVDNLLKQENLIKFLGGGNAT